MRSVGRLISLTVSLAVAACTASTATSSGSMSSMAPMPDPRVGLRAGLYNAQEAIWNLRVLSRTRPDTVFAGITNSDLAFSGNLAIQGNYNGYQIWDISNPSAPVLKEGLLCPASQSDVSVYKNLLFVSGEGLTGRLDCGTQGVRDTVSRERLRGLRIFDITDISHPRNVGNVQTCRGSHTHTVLVDPNDKDNVYVYISGSSGVRSPSELAGCVRALPNEDPNSPLFRIEVIKVPLAHPEQAAIVSSPRIFQDLAAPTHHADTPQDSAEDRAGLDSARRMGGFIGMVRGEERVIRPTTTTPLLDSIVKARGGTGTPTAADTATLRAHLQEILTAQEGFRGPRNAGPNQCHDITVYPAIGLAGGACGGYGLLLDIHDPAHPVRVFAAADSNFSFWHSATFNNDGTKLLFTDEWGGGTQPKCRAADPKDWGADALFTLTPDRRLQFKSYFKMPAVQTSQENCVAHNGSLIPIPGRDVMVQSWYQGGISVFDWTDVSHPIEIAYFDRGPVDATRLASGGTWSAYWYNGIIVSSEIARGLDILELVPSAFISQNEIDAAKTVHFDYYNTQGQQRFVWPPSFALARAYLDQLERDKGLPAKRISDIRVMLSSAETARAGGTLAKLSSDLANDAMTSSDAARVNKLAAVVERLAR